MKSFGPNSPHATQPNAPVSDRSMKHCRWFLLCLLATPVTLSARGASLSPDSPLDLGFRQMYNLQFSDAHKTFYEWEQTHSNDPLGPTADAAAYLFSEFDRLGILQSDLFVNDKKFGKRQVERPNPAVKKAFESALDKSARLAAAALAKSPQDANALFAEVMNLGLQADYQAFIEKRDLPSLAAMKRGGLLADKLLKIDPTCYDAYLALGVENYILGLKPAPVRWLLRLYGAQTDKNVGIEKLRLTASKGHFLRPFARLLLAVAALRGHHRERARELLQELAQEFPNNGLYRRELAKLQ
ncbi:MAG: hypothetical protein ACRD3T_06070 [Terriglobia bacterium]